MQKNRKTRGRSPLFLGIAAAALLVMMGCPSATDDGPSDSGVPVPQTPVITKIETGFELINVNLKNVTDTDAQNQVNQRAVVSFTWSGEGATSYNVYWSKDRVKPGTPQESGITETVYFARELDPDTDYYFWVEGVNGNKKSPPSDFRMKKTGKKGARASGGVERGDYPHNIKVVPGNRSLTVSWDLSDRVGWYEVYYTSTPIAFAKKGEAGTDDLQPYKKLDAAFATAIPWNGTAKGTAGTPVKFFGTSTTITDLEPGTAYEIWIRSPNANGERGYGYATGTPVGEDPLGAVSGVAVSPPAGTTRDLNVTWSRVSGADKYRIYASKYSNTPNVITASYDMVEGNSTVQYTKGGLDSNTTYYVWVVAEKNGAPGAFGTPVSGKTGTAPATGRVGDKFIKGSTTQKVKTLVYVEVNDHNPLNAGSYILEDGTYLFDYVVLFAANIRNRNCLANPSENGGCRENGVHVHFNEKVQYILDRRATYIKPLQDKGIKVILGLLGDHDGIGFGTMTDAQRTTFIADLQMKITRYNLDGVDFDDEWGSKEDWDNWSNDYATISPNSIWTYPTSTWGWPFSGRVFRDPNKGIETGNGTLTAPSDADMDRMWLESGVSFYKTLKAARDNLPGKIVTLYEYNTGRQITPNGVTNDTVTKEQLRSTVDFALQPWYNQYHDESGNGLPRSIFSPFGMDLGGQAYASQNGAPNPPITVGGNNRVSGTIHDYATRFKAAADSGSPYNVMYFYALRPASDLLKPQSNGRATVTKEEYMSIMTNIVFGQKVVLTAEGGNYTKDW